MRITINRMFARWEDRVARNRGAEPTSRVCCGMVGDGALQCGDLRRHAASTRSFEPLRDQSSRIGRRKRWGNLTTSEFAGWGIGMANGLEVDSGGLRAAAAGPDRNLRLPGRIRPADRSAMSAASASTTPVYRSADPRLRVLRALSSENGGATEESR